LNFAKKTYSFGSPERSERLLLPKRKIRIISEITIKNNRISEQEICEKIETLLTLTK
jgi:hypothetical protein